MFGTQSRRLTLLVIVAALMLLAASARADDEKDWKPLGNAKIERKSGSAKIDVGGEQGIFEEHFIEISQAEKQQGVFGSIPRNRYPEYQRSRVFH